MFSLLKSGQPRFFWAIMATVTCVGLALPAAWLFPRFEKPPFDESSIPTRIFALEEDDCAESDRILRKGQDRRHKYRLNLLAACVVIAASQVLDVARDGELTILLDRQLPDPGNVTGVPAKWEAPDHRRHQPENREQVHHPH